MTGLLLLCGCSTVIPDNVKADENTTDTYNLSFSSEELDGSYEINGSTYISLGNENAGPTFWKERWRMPASSLPWTTVKICSLS